MKLNYILLGLLLLGIHPSIKSYKEASNYFINNYSTPISEIVVQEQIKNTNDSIEKQMFWNLVIVPILKKDKEKVLSNMDFPIRGKWTTMMSMAKNPNEASIDDFMAIYDKFFNNNFITELSKESYKNIFINTRRDTTWYIFSVNRKSGEGKDYREGGVQLQYYKKNNSFKLKNVDAAGGDFYSDYF
jgi:hypothetical protein